MNYTKHIKNIIYLSAGLYISIKLLNNQELYYYILANLGNPNAMYKLANLYKTRHDYVNMEKYYKLSAQAGNSTASLELAKYYELKEDYKNMSTYYLYAISYNNSDASKYYADYLFNKKDYNNALTYYLLDSDKNYLNISKCYYYLNQNNDISEKYYILSIQNDPKSSIQLIKKLIEYYDLTKNYDKLIKYNLLLLKYTNDMCYIINIFNNDLIRKYYIKYLQTQNIIKIYDQNCPICLDDNNELIDPVILSCGHTYCLSCLLYLTKYTYKCSLCRSVVS